MYLKRNIEATLTEFLKSFPIIGLTGPRQSGKTTLLQSYLKDYQYVSMDDFLNLQFFNQDPQAFIEKYNNKVIFDEVHFAPKLLSFLKNLVDKDRKNYGKFIITSSSQFYFFKQITESLAGRIGLLSLLPLELAEFPLEFSDQIIIRGSYPELVLNPIIKSNHWYNSYLGTYLDKDVRQLSNIGNMNDFRKLITLLASRIGQILDMQNLATSIGITIPTIKHWISILEASYIVFLLQPYYKNLGKRISKRPKIYFYDSGLVSFLTGIETTKHFNNGPMSGSLFENYIIAEILKNNTHKQNYKNLYYFRTNNGDEIDLIIDNTKHLELIEIKNTSTFTPEKIKHIKKYLTPNDKGFLIYRGEYFEYSKEISAINFIKYLNHK